MATLSSLYPPDPKKPLPLPEGLGSRSQCSTPDKTSSLTSCRSYNLEGAELANKVLRQ